MPQFSTNEAVSLEKRAETEPGLVETPAERISDVYELPKCAAWIKENSYRKVCLQFPDYLLPDCCEVAFQLEAEINDKVYVMADTAYGSCCVDYVAASHVPADAIIHFGRTCFSKPDDSVPCLKIYEKYPLDLSALRAELEAGYTHKNAVLLADTGYYHILDEIKACCGRLCEKVCTVDDDLDLDDRVVVYLGECDRKLLNIYLLHSPKELYYKPKSSHNLQTYQRDNKVLNRRYFLVEKIKDSNVIGIVIATLAVKDYLKILQRMKTLINNSAKKYYVISVGKPTVAKLANFQEIDVFVVIGCSLNEIYDDRDYYKPIVTPHDVETALNPTNDLRFSYDYSRITEADREIRTEQTEDDGADVSLISGKIRTRRRDETATDDSDSQVALKTDGTVAASSDFGAGYLASRSWKGLEQNLGKTEVMLATEGRSGTAQGYQNEKAHT